MPRLLAVTVFALLLSPATAPRPHVLGISHVGLRVSDVAASRAFYEEFLGLRGSRVGARQYVELIPGLALDEDRLDHVALETDDAEGLRRHLASRGVDVPDRVTRDEAGRRFTVHDPDGHAVELVQASPPRRPAPGRSDGPRGGPVSGRILHLGIIVGDVPAALKFYVDFLGLAESWRGSRSGTELSWINVMAPDGGEYVEFMLYGERPPRVSAGRSTTSAWRSRTSRTPRPYWRRAPIGPRTRGRWSRAWARTGSASSTSTTPTAPASS